MSKAESRRITAPPASRHTRSNGLGSQALALLAAVCCLFALGAAAPAAFAQKSSGVITGSVVDQNGAALYNAKVTVTQLGTNLQREVNTNQDGNYTVPDLPVGTYRISATQTGFKETVVDGVVVNVSTTTRQDFTMQVGQIGERVDIVADAVQIQQETGAVGDVITGEQVRELPLNGRSFVQLTQLQPGVSPAANFDSKNKGLFSGVDFSVNGNTTQSNLFLIDGANNNDTGSNRTILLYPSIEAIGEFTMLRNSFSPEYGQASGAIISISTQFGKNDFHGSLFYFGRNDKLNAADFFANRVGGTKDKLRRNDFGGSLGGPILKDRLFFFYSQEFNKEIRGQTRFGSVPTLLERQGNFSQPRFAPNGTRCSGAAIGNGRPGEATQIIPQANISPAGLAIVQLFPEPNIASPNDCNNWRTSTNSPIDFREENIRIDYRVTENNHLFGRYTQDHWENPAPILFSAGLWGDDAFPGVESSWKQPSKQAALKLSTTLGNSGVNEVQFSYSANRINISPDQGGDLNESLTAAIPGFFPESGKLNAGQRAHPTFWGGIAPYSTNFGPDLWTAAPWKNSLDIYSIRDDFSKVTGNHNFKMGFLYDWAAKDEDSLGAAASESPQFWGACCADNSGNYLADILTRGSRFGYSETSTQPFARTRYRNFELYFGDTWKVKPNLTLELGARYSYFPEPFDADDRMTSFDLRFYNPSRPSSDFCNGIVVVPGTNPCAGIPGVSTPTEGVNRALRANDKNAIAPRLGFAWDPKGNGKTAIRGGVGQFFQRERVSIALGMVANAPFALAVGGTRTLDGTSGIAVDGPPGGAPSRATNPEALLPNAWQWNLTVDRELWKDSVLEIGYVGNRALHQLISFDINQVLPQNRVAAAFCPDAACVNALRPARNFGFIVGFERSGSANYHSLQTMFKTRLFGKSQIQAAYTWSHSLGDAALDDSSGGASVNTRTDTYNGRIDYGNTGINRPHIFVLNSVLYMDDFTGFKGKSDVVEAILGGWEFATIYTASSGSSIIPRVANGSISNLQSGGLAGTGTSQSNVRPRRVPGVPCTINSPNEPFQIINPAAFTLVGAVIGQPGDAARGACLGPGINNVDMSFYKNFTPDWLQKPFGEQARIQLRLEFFNAFNHAQFKGDSLQNNMFINTGGNPVLCGNDTTCTPANRVISSFVPNGGFGRSGTTRGPREIQYALKLVF